MYSLREQTRCAYLSLKHAEAHVKQVPFSAIKQTFYFQMSKCASGMCKSQETTNSRPMSPGEMQDLDAAAE